MIRKGLMSVVCTLVVGVALAQPAKVLNAYNYMQDGELVKAQAEIEPAIENEKTMVDGKTWYYRGQIYEQIYFSDDESVMSLKDGSLMKAVESYAKATELGSKRINMNDVTTRYQRLGSYCYQEGVNQFNEKKYESALKYFTTCYTVRGEGGAVDSGAYYSAGVSAMRAGQADVAEKNFRKCIEIGYSVEDSYINLADMFKASGETEKYKALLGEARKALPNSQEIITAEINIYLENEEYDKALENLDLAINNDPSNHLLYFIRGNIYDNKQANMVKDGKREESMDAYNKAKSDYQKAIEIKPEHFDAIYSLGALHYNKGADMLNEANMISDDGEYKKAKEAAEAEMMVALPFLEKAHDLDPSDMSTMTSLKELYARTNQMDKYNAMNEKLKN